MANKSVSNVVLDSALNYIADNGTEVYLCTSPIPTDFASVQSQALLSMTLTAGAGNGDYIITDGTGGDGRRLQVGVGVTTIEATATGAANFIAITNGTNELIFVTDVEQKQVVTGTNVDIGSWFIVMPDPVPVT